MEPNLIIHQGKHYLLAVKKHVFIQGGVTRTLAPHAKVQRIEFFPHIVDAKPKLSSFKSVLPYQAQEPHKATYYQFLGWNLWLSDLLQSREVVTINDEGLFGPSIL